MYAVVGVWDMDPAMRQAQTAALEHIVPRVAQLPGVVNGYWSDFAEPGRSHTFIVFETRDAAESFAAEVRGNAENQGSSGVRNLGLELLEIQAALDPD